MLYEVITLSFTDPLKKKENPMTETFKALLVEQPEQKHFTRSVVNRTLADLPDGELVVRVRWSSLNYKDALSATGHPGVTRNFPHTPGIDAAGEVVSDSSNRFNAGDPVIVTGFDLGMETDGGYGQMIRIPAAWAVITSYSIHYTKLYESGPPTNRPRSAHQTRRRTLRAA